MAIRTTMQGMIDYLRMYGACATDETYQGVTYWTDAQLQDILDSKAQHGGVVLRRYTDTLYQPNCPRFHRFEDDVIVVDDNGTQVTGATYDPTYNEFTIPTAQTVQLYAKGLKVNLYEALAALWDVKAAQRYDKVNWKAGNNRMDVNQEYMACIAKRDYYRARIIRKFPRISGRWTTR